MRYLVCYQTKNPCFKQARKADQKGILVHSTGCVNSYLKRYVDCPEELGKNPNNNTGNREDASSCMHGWIGRDKNGQIAYIQTLPYDYACWGCGKGSKGSYNYNPVAHIQFEICEGTSTDVDYYRKAVEAAENVCVLLCKQYGWSSADITSHYEAHALGYAGDHADPKDYMKNFGDSMDAFRARVQAKLDAEGYTAPVVTTATETASEPQETAQVTVSLYELKKGVEGQKMTVKKLQTLLKLCGYKVTADGVFGAKTDAVVRQYQSDNGLYVDGIVGKKTWTMLING